MLRNPVNRYGYKPQGLFIPYALATFFSLVVVLLGLYSFIRDGVNPDRRYEDIVAAVGDSDTARVIKSRQFSVTARKGEGGLIWRAGTARVERRTSVAKRVGTWKRVGSVGRVRVLWARKGRGERDGRGEKTERASVDGASMEPTQRAGGQR